MVKQKTLETLQRSENARKAASPKVEWEKGLNSKKFTLILKAMFIYNNKELIGIFQSRNGNSDIDITPFSKKTL